MSQIAMNKNPLPPGKPMMNLGYSGVHNFICYVSWIFYVDKIQDQTVFTAGNQILGVVFGCCSSAIPQGLSMVWLFACVDNDPIGVLMNDLAEYSRGLVCLTGGEEGPLASALMSGGEAAGREVVERLVRIFGPENVYIEVQRHRERMQEWRNQAALRIAESLRLPVLATNGVRYATKYDREIADLFTAIRNHTQLDQAGRLLALNNQRHLRPADRMVALFRDIPGAVENTVDLSSRLAFQLSDLGYASRELMRRNGVTQ